MESESPEFVVVPVREGELVASVVYVGATGLDPHTRVWLHLHDTDPEVGRVASRFDRVETAELDVLAMVVPDVVSRADVRDVLGAASRRRGSSPRTPSRTTCSSCSSPRRTWSSWSSASSDGCARTSRRACPSFRNLSRS